MPLIELRPGSTRFDSVTEANDKGDADKLRTALMANIKTIMDILGALELVKKRYEPQLHDLLADLAKVELNNSQQSGV